MRISYLATTLLAICFLPLSTVAFASCGSTSCASGGKTITYGSGSYGSHVSQGINTRYGIASAAACPSGSTRAHDGFCISNGSSSTFGVSSGTTYASSTAYGSSHRSTFRSTGKVVPFTRPLAKFQNTVLRRWERMNS